VPALGDRSSRTRTDPPIVQRLLGRTQIRTHEARSSGGNMTSMTWGPHRSRQPVCPPASPECPLGLRSPDHCHLLGEQLVLPPQALVLLVERPVQKELATHLRVTAPLRPVQELPRHTAGERRRRTAGAIGVKPPQAAAPQPAAALVITDDQAARHPLLSRTRDWLKGGSPLAGRTSARRARRPCPGRRPRLLHRALAAAGRAHRAHPGAGGPGRHPGRRRLRSVLDSIVAQFPDARFEVVPNRGRNMWPFVRGLEFGLLGL
jgi:hypothetical protein